MMKPYSLLLMAVLFGTSLVPATAALPVAPPAIVQTGAEGFGPKEVLLFPNPAVDRINVQFNLEENGTANIQLFDVLGNDLKMPRTFELDESTRSAVLMVNSLRPGIYVVKVVFTPRQGNTKVGYYRVNVNN